jgi:hypothetical protein
LAEPNQYLRLELGGIDYLLPSTAGFSIEQRESLIENSNQRSSVIAWREVRSARWPAYSLDGNLNLTRPDDWHRAVFLDAPPRAVGLIANEVQLLPRGRANVSPFVPLGPSTLRTGHLFAGVWIDDKRIVLVFDPARLVSYLLSLGD